MKILKIQKMLCSCLHYFPEIQENMQNQINKHAHTHLNYWVREDLERANGKNKRDNDFLVAIQHIGQRVLHLRLNLEPVNLVRTHQFHNNVRQWKKSVEDEQEDGVVAIQKVIGFLGRVSEP